MPFASLAEKLRPSGRIAYWNFLVPRRSPESLRSICDHLKRFLNRSGAKTGLGFIALYGRGTSLIDEPIPNIGCVPLDECYRGRKGDS